MMLDPKATFDEVIERYSPDEESRRRILDNRIYQQISGALAGSQEYMAMEKLYELDDGGEFDLLILDTPPSRNALDFLDAPRRVTQFVEGRAMRLFIRPTGFGARIAGRGFAVVSSVLRRVTGGDLIADLSEFFSAMAGLLGGFRDRAERVEALLGDERTTFLIVTGPAGRADRGGGLPARQARRSADLPLGGGDRQPRPHDERARRATTATPRGALSGVIWRTKTSSSGSWPPTRRARSSPSRDREQHRRRCAPAHRECPVFEVPELSDEIHDLDGLRAFAQLLMPEDDPEDQPAARRGARLPTVQFVSVRGNRYWTRALTSSRSIGGRESSSRWFGPGREVHRRAVVDLVEPAGAGRGPRRLAVRLLR